MVVEREGGGGSVDRKRRGMVVEREGGGGGIIYTNMNICLFEICETFEIVHDITNVKL